MNIRTDLALESVNAARISEGITQTTRGKAFKITEITIAEDRHGAKIGKKKLITISGAISVIAGLIMLVLPITPDNKGILIYVIGLMVVNVGCCVFQIIVWAIIADCIEMSYRKKGVREEASLYALYSFFRKLSQGIGSALVALALSKVGYVETAVTQTAEASKNIKNLYIIFLVIGLAIMTLSMWFIYNIDYKQEQSFAQSNEEQN